MNTTQTETTAIAAVQPFDTGRSSAGNLMLSSDTMSTLMRVADLMASGKSTVPQHLQKNPADCMAVCMQAMQWGMNPFAVAQKTHIVNGTLGYEAQLVNAVVLQSNAIVGHFHYEYKGASPSMECRVGAVLRGDAAITWGEWLSEAKVTTKNSPLWKTNPRQQLGYLQVKNWARLYAPGAILGVYTPDEFDAPLPRNMGPVVPLEEVSPGVLEAAENAAREGVATYSEFWKSASADTRKAIGKDEHNRLKDIAIAADKSRTVEPKPQKTFPEVMELLCAATSEDGLYVASDWINAIASTEEQAILNDKFDERLAQLRGAA